MIEGRVAPPIPSINQPRASVVIAALVRADRQRGEGLGADSEIATEANSAVNHLAFDTNQPGLFFANAKGHPWSAAGDWLMIRDVVMMAVMVALFLALTVRRAN